MSVGSNALPDGPGRMRRRMEAGLRHAQPAQAVAALQDLSTGAFRSGPITRSQTLLINVGFRSRKAGFRDSLFRGCCRNLKRRYMLWDGKTVTHNIVCVWASNGGLCNSLFRVRFP